MCHYAERPRSAARAQYHQGRVRAGPDPDDRRRETPVPWSTATGVSAGCAKLHRNSETWPLLSAFEMERDGRGRLLLAGEAEPACLPLTTLLHFALLEIAAFGIRGAELVTAAAPIELYRRANGVGTTALVVNGQAGFVMVLAYSCRSWPAPVFSNRIAFQERAGFTKLILKRIRNAENVRAELFPVPFRHDSGKRYQAGYARGKRPHQNCEFQDQPHQSTSPSGSSPTDVLLADAARLALTNDNAKTANLLFWRELITI